MFSIISFDRSPSEIHWSLPVTKAFLLLSYSFGEQIAFEIRLFIQQLIFLTHSKLTSPNVVKPILQLHQSVIDFVIYGFLVNSYC